MRRALIALLLMVAAVLGSMVVVMVVALNLVLGGFHPECGIWRNAVPFACTPAPKTSSPASPTRAAPAPTQRVKANTQNNSSVRAQSSQASGHARICGNWQPEPYRVQCNSGVCYHDIGFRGACGLADNR